MTDENLEWWMNEEWSWIFYLVKILNNMFIPTNTFINFDKCFHQYYYFRLWSIQNINVSWKILEDNLHMWQFICNNICREGYLFTVNSSYANNCKVWKQINQMQNLWKKFHCWTLYFNTQFVKIVYHYSKAWKNHFGSFFHCSDLDSTYNKTLFFKVWQFLHDCC